MGATKQAQLDEMENGRCIDCVHWISPGRAKMDGLRANTCGKCSETVFENNNCLSTNMADNHFEPIDID